MKSVFCPVCNHENEIEQTYHRYSEEFEQEFYLGKCPQCGTLITYPQLTTKQLTDYYKDEEQIGTDRYKKWKKKYRYQYNFLKSELRQKQNNILEIGCNTGNLLRYFKERGHIVSGLELSKNASRYGREVNDVDITNSGICDFECSDYDVIVLIHTFEHINTPSEFLKCCYERLSENGLLFIDVPSATSKAHELLGESKNILSIPFHSYLYTLESLTEILHKNGFRVVKRRQYSAKEDNGIISIAISDWFNLLLIERKLPKPLAYILFKLFRSIVRFYPLRKFLGWIYGNIGKGESIAVIAEKMV